MRGKFQFGLQALAAATLLALPLAAAQNPHPDRPPQRQSQPHASAPRPQNSYHPPAQNNHPNNRPNPYQPPRQNFNQPPHRDFNSPPNRGNENGARNGSGAGYVPTPRQPTGGGAARPWRDQMRDLSPGQRERVFQNSKTFQNLPPDQQAKIRQQFNQWDRMNPSQQADLRQKERIWDHLTPGQREHIKNDVLPRMRQMPWDRQQIINQKLGVLQNMPESARNQRLNDPNFTRGMSDEEKSTLHDLAHMHVGAPDEPPSQ